MKKSLRYIFGLLVLFASFFISIKDTYADNGVHLIISPVNVFLDLNPNSEVEKEFRLENASDNATNYRIYTLPYTLDNETGSVNFSTNTKYSDLKDWITFYDGEDYRATLTGTLEPNSSITIKYKILVPSNPPAAGQYASIFAETIDDAETVTSTNIKANVRIGLNLITKTNVEKQLAADIVSNKIPLFLLGDAVVSSFEIKNSGNIHVDAIQEFRVENMFGELVHEEEIAKIVMPEKSLFVETSWKDSTGFGIYHVSSTITIPALDLISIKTTLAIVVPPLLLAIIIILVVAIITLIVLLVVRKNKLRKLRKSIL